MCVHVYGLDNPFKDHSVLKAWSTFKLRRLGSVAIYRTPGRSTYRIMGPFPTLKLHLALWYVHGPQSDDTVTSLSPMGMDNFDAHVNTIALHGAFGLVKRRRFFLAHNKEDGHQTRKS